MTEDYVGEQYEEWRPLRDIADLIRKDVLRLRDAGELPYDKYRVYINLSHRHIFVRHWGVGTDVSGKLEAIARPYNYARDDGTGLIRRRFQLYSQYPDAPAADKLWKQRQQGELAHLTEQAYEAQHARLVEQQRLADTTPKVVAPRARN